METLQYGPRVHFSKRFYAVESLDENAAPRAVRSGKSLPA